MHASGEFPSPCCLGRSPGQSALQSAKLSERLHVQERMQIKKLNWQSIANELGNKLNQSPTAEIAKAEMALEGMLTARSESNEDIR